MPFVRIELFPGRTREQKAAAAQAVTEALVNSFIGLGPQSVYVTFWEMQREDCAVAGVLKDETLLTSKDV